MKFSIKETEARYNYDFANEIESFKDQFDITELSEEDLFVEFCDSSDGIGISLILANSNDYHDFPGLHFNMNGEYVIYEMTEPSETEEWVRENVLQNN